MMINDLPYKVLKGKTHGDPKLWPLFQCHKKYVNLLLLYFKTSNNNILKIQ